MVMKPRRFPPPVKVQPKDRMGPRGRTKQRRPQRRLARRLSKGAGGHRSAGDGDRSASTSADQPRVHRLRGGRLVPLQTGRDHRHRPRLPLAEHLVGSFNGRLRDELLNGCQLSSVLEAKVLIEDWRMEYNFERPHSALGMLSPAEFARAGRRSIANKQLS